MRLYLAHPFGSRNRMRTWELMIEKYLNIDIVNPFYDVERPDKNVINEVVEDFSLSKKIVLWIGCGILFLFNFMFFMSVAVFYQLHYIWGLLLVFTPPYIVAIALDLWMSRKTEGSTDLSTLASRDERYSMTDEQCRELVDRDLDLIEHCDGVIVIIDGELSYGTIQEMVYASTYCRKPVYSVISNGHQGHPWLRVHSTKIFTALEDLHTYLHYKAGMREIERQ